MKIVAEKKYDEVLGVHIIGPHATELIAEATAALNLEATAESLFHAFTPTRRCPRRWARPRWPCTTERSTF